MSATAKPRRKRLREWILDREVIWDEPTPRRPSGRYRARFVATEAEAGAITKAVDEALDRGEGLLSHVRYSETEILLSWRLATHPKKAVPGAKRGRPRNDAFERVWQGLRISRATAYRLRQEVRAAREAAVAREARSP
jgi:hypothetical protein